MTPARLNLEEFPDSAHAHALRRGAIQLRFEAALETEYTGWHLQRVRLRAKMWFALACARAVFYTVPEWPRGGIWTASILAHIGVLIPCTAALAWLPWSRQYRRLFLPVARVLVPICSALAAIFIAHNMLKGQVEVLAVLTVDVVAVFFFCGLMFRQAILSALILLIAFATTASMLGLAQALLLKSMLMLALTGIISAIVYRDIEQAYRRSFLEGALIKELVARDELTGLMNRRSFDEHLLRVWLFKRYNDVRGHQAGDQALRGVARVIHQVARRPLDLAARYGGEEFAIILYDLGLAQVLDVAERLRQAVQNLPAALHDSAVHAQAGHDGARAGEPLV